MSGLERMFRDGTSIVPLAYKRRVFDSTGIYKDIRPHGETIEEMVQSVPDLPERFWEQGIVCINGDEVHREMWRLVRPKATHPLKPIAVTLHLPPAGGGGGARGREGGGGKGAGGAIFGIVAALALTVVTAGIAGGFLLPGISAALGAGLGLSSAAGASILAGAVGLAGALALSALTPPPAVAPTSAVESASDEAKEAASAEGNVIAPGGAIPRVIGTRKVFPALACEPITELIGDDEYVEAVYILNGPHALSDIRIGDTALADAQDVEYQLREGWEDDSIMDLSVGQARTHSPQLELSTHAVDTEEPDKLKHPSNPALDLPVWHTLSTKDSPDEVWIHLLLPQGLNKNADVDNDRSIPIRIRMKKRGDSTWINLPEVHISDRTSSQRRRAFIIHFGLDGMPESVPSIPSRSGFFYAHIAVPGQDITPETAGWTAHSTFDNGTGTNTYMFRGNEGATRVAKTFLYDNRVEFFLDEATFPPGIYDIQIKRGYQFGVDGFSKAAYELDADVRDFFHYEGSAEPGIHTPRQNVAEQLYVTRVVSVWNEHPVPKSGFAIIAIKARNRRVENLSCLASGYVKDWDGSGWNTWATTSNPAAHYVDVLSGRLNLDPLPDDLRDDESLVAWRTLCASEGWTCDTIAEDVRTQDLLTLIASCGYARPYQSEIYGVTIDKDVSADAPIQVFTPRNSTGFRWERSFPRLPDGFVVTFRDSANDYNDEQEIVFRSGYEGGDGGILEAVTYDGLVDRSKVIARARFDLDQADQRGSFYYLDADAEAIVCRRGDLIALQHDTLIKRTGTARIRSKVLSGSDIVGFVLDSHVPVTNEPDMHATTDLHSVTDMHMLGKTTGLIVRRSDGTFSTHTISTATGETKTVTLTTPIANVDTIEGLDDTYDKSGSLVVTGDAGSEYRRCLVSSITPGPEMRFGLALVDEAPNLVRG